MLLTNIFEDISQDFHKPQYSDAKVLSRRYILKNRCSIQLNLNRESRLCEVGYLLPESYNVNELMKIPKWKGMEKRVSTFTENSSTKQYLFFTQLEGYEPRIFLILMQEICDNINDCDDLSKLIYIIHIVLNKWSIFFQDERELVLTVNKQQGLYSELYILEKLISLKGSVALKCWTGCNAEEHDFYIESMALEVKSSSSKGPDKIIINNEYQLDDSGLLGKLFVVYIKIKKSTQDGETLSKMVERICERLELSERINFVEKLFKSGYIHELRDLYKYHFVVRDESYYIVKDSFPRITPKTLNRGIGSVEYIVSLDACNQYQITAESFYKEVK